MMISNLRRLVGLTSREWSRWFRHFLSSGPGGIFASSVPVIFRKIRNSNLEIPNNSENDEIRMTKLEGMTNDQMARQTVVSLLRHSCFVVLSSFDIRAWSFLVAIRICFNIR